LIFDHGLSQVINKYRLFENNPMFVGAPYSVQTSVSLTNFRDFLTVLEGNSVTMTNSNFPGLLKLSDFRRVQGFGETEDSEARARIAVLEERSEKRDRNLALLESEFARLVTDFERLTGEVSELRTKKSRLRFRF
jgi:hypothetical protein